MMETFHICRKSTSIHLTNLHLVVSQAAFFCFAFRDNDASIYSHQFYQLYIC